MCLPSRGHVSLVILSSFHVCSALSNTKLTRNSEESSPSQSKKETTHEMKGENKIHKLLKENLIRKMQITIFQLESQLYQSQTGSLIDQGDKKSNRKIKSVSQEQSKSQRKVHSKLEKKSPRCLFECLQHRHLHPAQCHHLCTMSVG